MKEGVRISKDGSIASAEYLRLFVVGKTKLNKEWWIEAVHRANMKADNRGVVTAKDIQRILPELFLDF